MPFHDLNIAYIQDHAVLANTLLFAKEIGYNTVALSLNIHGQVPEPPQRVPIAKIAIPSALRVLTRLTLTVSDPSQNYRLPNLLPSYDIVALRPTDANTFQQCCNNLECDLISLDFAQRLHFPIKFSTVSSALSRGIRFEICYSQGVVGGGDARRNLISGATQLIRATRGRGIVVSSEAKNALGLRAPWDVINLEQIWGLSQQRAKEAVCEEADKVIRLAAIKRTSFRGVVDVVDGGQKAPTVSKDKVSNPSNGAVSVQSSAIQDTVPKTAQQTNPVPLNGAKRKASISSLNSTSQTTEPLDNKPLSKNQRKKMAKKARSEGNAVPSRAANGTTRAFPIQHESIADTTNKPK